MASEVFTAREGNVNPQNAMGGVKRESMESFLSGYAPKNRGFTSNAEIKKISKALGLDGKSYKELNETRNNVVKYYSNLMKGDDRIKYMPSLQSVTSVIDYIKVNKYGIGAV